MITKEALLKEIDEVKFFYKQSGSSEYLIMYFDLCSELQRMGVQPDSLPLI